MKSGVVGENWRVALKGELMRTTHAIVLLTPDYEESPSCRMELETLLARQKDKEAPTILAYLIDGRERMHDGLAQLGIHHGRIDEHGPSHAVEAAEHLLQNLLGALQPSTKGRRK
jgi:hypothetical protein